MVDTDYWSLFLCYQIVFLLKVEYTGEKKDRGGWIKKEIITENMGFEIRFKKTKKNFGMYKKKRKHWQHTDRNIWN